MIRYSMIMALAIVLSGFAHASTVSQDSDTQPSAPPINLILEIMHKAISALEKVFGRPIEKKELIDNNEQS
jgi:hypothetical protein